MDQPTGSTTDTIRIYRTVQWAYQESEAGGQSKNAERLGAPTSLWASLREQAKSRRTLFSIKGSDSRLNHCPYLIYLESWVSLLRSLADRDVGVPRRSAFLLQ